MKEFYGDINENEIEELVIEGLLKKYNINKNETDKVTTIIDTFREDINKEVFLKVNNTISNYDTYKLNKIKYLNENYNDNNGTNSTRRNYWNLYKSHIYYAELAHGKDLMDFSTDEIKGVLETISSRAYAVKGNIKSFIRQYCAVAFNKGLILSNPFSGLEVNKNIPQKIVKLKYVDMDEFKELIDKAIVKDVKKRNIFLTVCLRYGIEGVKSEFLKNLTMSSIDRKNKLVSLSNEEGNITTLLPIDDYFLRILDMHISENDIGNEDWIFNEKRDDMATLWSRSVFTTIKVKPIKSKDLVLSRKIDLIKELKKRKGNVSIADIKIINNLVSPQAASNAWFKVKDEYEIITEDKVIVPPKNPKGRGNSKNKNKKKG